MSGSSGPFGSADNSQQSSSKTITTTNQQDRRIVADNGGIGLSTDNSNISLTTTDHGAVAAGRDVALNAIDRSAANAALITQASLDLSKMFNASTSHLFDQVTSQNQAALQTVSAVVSKPLNAADPQRVLLYVAVAAVVIVGFVALKGKL